MSSGRLDRGLIDPLFFVCINAVAGKVGARAVPAVVLSVAIDDIFISVHHDFRFFLGICVYTCAWFRLVLLTMSFVL